MCTHVHPGVAGLLQVGSSEQSALRCMVLQLQHLKPLSTLIAALQHALICARVRAPHLPCCGMHPYGQLADGHLSSWIAPECPTVDACLPGHSLTHDTDVVYMRAKGSFCCAARLLLLN
jgi:hypothetical protein